MIQTPPSPTPPISTDVHVQKKLINRSWFSSFFLLFIVNPVKPHSGVDTILQAKSSITTVNYWIYIHTLLLSLRVMAIHTSDSPVRRVGGLEVQRLICSDILFVLFCFLPVCIALMHGIWLRDRMCVSASMCVYLCMCMWSSVGWTVISLHLRCRTVVSN